jgi:hypothetical protein
MFASALSATERTDSMLRNLKTSTPTKIDRKNATKPVHTEMGPASPVRRSVAAESLVDAVSALALT